jgi:hypothetical protein
MTHRPLQHTKIYTKRSTTATYKWTPTPSSQGSLVSSSRFKEHLSLTIPPPDPSREHSRFSADTPTGHTFSLGEFATHKYSPHSKPPDLEDGSAGSLDKWSTTRRFLHFFSSLWASRKEGGDSFVPGVALAVPKIPEWRPFNIGRQATQGPSAPCDEPPLTRIQRLRERAPIAALVVFLLYLFINVIILNVRLFSLTRMPVERSVIATPMNTSTTSYELPANTQQCITQYTLNASNDPIGYPCNTCLPLLAAFSMSEIVIYPAALDATQFCSLRSIWEDAGQLGQAGLEAGGWVQDIEFCTWSGVRCDGTSRVVSLSVFMIFSLPWLSLHRC